MGYWSSRTGAQKRVRCFVGYWSFPHSVEVHGPPLVLQLFLFDSEDQDNFGGILHAKKGKNWGVPANKQKETVQSGNRTRVAATTMQNTNHCTN